MFENDNQHDRQQLIESLHKEGVPAREFNSGGGIMQVIIPIIDTNSEPSIINSNDPNLRNKVEEYISKSKEIVELFISTNSLFSECEIGIYGTEGLSGAQVSNDWKSVSSLDEAVELILSFWSQRDIFLENYITGKRLAKEIS